MFESEAAAAEALAAANSGEQAAPATPDAQVEQGATTDAVDSFTSIDPDSLPEEQQALYKQLQGDYTRKTQEVAPWRKIASEFDLDADGAREALTLVQNLQNPDFQKALYERLHGAFAEDGGDNAADFDTEGEDGFDDPRDKQLQQLNSRLEQFEERQLRNEVESKLNRDEAVIRSENPNWSDEDMQMVAQLAIANGGDMLKGAEVFKGWSQRVLGSHIERKAQVPAGASAPAASGHAAVPTQFKSLDEAHDAALVHYREALAL